MRPLEILLSLSLVVSVASLIFLPKSRPRFWIIWFGLILESLVQAALEGAHWQIIPLYLAVFLMGFPALPSQNSKARPAKLVIIGIFSLFAVAASVALSWLMPMFQLPKPTGPYAVGTKILYLIDQNRPEENGPSPSGKRELMVQAWFPAERPTSFPSLHLANYQRLAEVTPRASYRSVLKTNSYLNATVRPGGPYPILIYNPSWMGERTEGTFQTEELASHGFVVVAVDHTFFGGRVQFPDGRVSDSRGAPELGNFDHSTAEEQAALGRKFVRIEAQDDSFVLDRLTAMNEDPSSPWFHRLDLSRVGALGFSIGGATAAQFAYQDPRVKAALNLDGWTFGDAGPHGISQPFMVIYEDKSLTLPSEAQLHSPSPAVRAFWQFSQDDYDHVIDGLRNHGGYQLFIAGTHHVDFTDRSLLSPLRKLTGGGVLDPVRAHIIMNAYTLAFFSHVLKGDPESLLQSNSSPYPEVEAHRFDPAAPQP
jgi:predicted dienelactone hydrolase